MAKKRLMNRLLRALWKPRKRITGINRRDLDAIERKLEEAASGLFARGK